ncbi:MAG: hypothetical protein ACYCX4_17810 [Bacillota bacterium]
MADQRSKSGNTVIFIGDIEFELILEAHEDVWSSAWKCSKCKETEESKRKFGSQKEAHLAAMFYAGSHFETHRMDLLTELLEGEETEKE